MFINIAGHDGTETSSSFHPCPSMGYAQFSIRGAVGAYSIHLSAYFGVTGFKNMLAYIPAPALAPAPASAPWGWEWPPPLSDSPGWPPQSQPL